jgi:dTDP-4-amino-4,6-dideoxygalactose transaminase
MKVSVVDLTSLHAQIRDEIDEAVDRVISKGRYVLDSEVEAFEEEFGSYVNARYCIGVGNGTEALALSLHASGVKPGSEVVVPTNTCSPTWLAIVLAGAVPVPIDPDPVTMTLDPLLLEDAITGATSAVVPVHLYGMPANLGTIQEICAPHEIAVVDDAAQAHGAIYQSRRIGGICNATAWSFYPTKNLGAIGDGGAITTDDEGIAQAVRSLRNYGWHRGIPYVSYEIGWNSRLDELQAAILRVKLRHLDEWNARRSAIASKYSGSIRVPGIGLPVEPPWATSVWHQYVIRCSSRRDALQAWLKKGGVETLVHYPMSPALQPFAERYHPASHLSQVGRRLSTEVLSLPIGWHLTDEAVDYVIDLLNSFEDKA